MFTCENVENIPQKYRAKHIDTRLAELSPFSETAFYICWFGSTAAVWFWDKGALETRLNSLSYEIVNFYPETVLYEKQSEGTSIGQCLEGVEEQTWDADGGLVMSRWLPETVSKVTARTLRIRPFQISVEQFKNSSLTSLIQLIVVVFFIIWTAILTGKLAGVSLKQNLTKTEIASLSQSSETTLQAKSSALNNLSEIETIVQHLETRDSFRFFTNVSDTLNSLDATLVRWQMEGKNITIIIKSAASNPLLFVEKLQSLEGIDSVQINASGQNTQTELTIKRL